MRIESREQTLNRLVLAYEKDLLRMCCVYLHDIQLAEDAVQETFLKVYRSLDRFRGECSEKIWLMRIGVNTCKNVRRSAWFRYVDGRVTLDQLPEPAQTPNEEHRMLTEAIMSLPRREMEIVLLYYDQGMQVQEIAQALGAVAAVRLSAREIVERQVVPMALENDGGGVNETFTHEELARVVELAEENGVDVPEKIQTLLENGEGYWEEETIMALAKAQFGPIPGRWTLEEQYWFEDSAQRRRVFFRR